jgi:hypothetical protein
MRTGKFYLALCIFFALATHTIWAQDEEVTVSITNMDNEQLRQTMENNASLLLTAFNKAARTGRKPAIPSGIVTKEAKNKLQDLWSMSAMACKTSVIQERYLVTYEKEYQIRNIPMVMYAADSDSTKYEEIALNFAADGMISDIIITVKEHQYMHVEWEAVSDIEQEQRIKEFIDLFRDAYNCKDINILGAFFSNNALIITGRKVQEKPNSNEMLKKALPGKKYELQVQSKSQYLTKLKDIFKKNDYINIVFDSIEIVKHPNPELKYVYSATMKQHWNSSTYKDVGYLFLLINCINKNKMEIFVRTWQPEQEVDSYDDIFGFSTFKIEVL